MALKLEDRTVELAGVVGSGAIGPDIALHFLETVGRAGGRVVVVDIAQEALDRGRERVAAKIGKKVTKGRMKPEAAEALLARITFTRDRAALAGADLVVEAASEDLAVKRQIFAGLEATCRADAILTSNSSHLPPDELFAEAAHPERCAVTHYFFPAERNPVVEVVPGGATAPATTAALMQLYELTGKLPVRVGGRYGYAVDPVFEGLFLAAALAVEAGLGTVKEVDAACARALGQGVGPFTAMNLTRGNPLTRVGLSRYGEAIMPWFRVPALLEAQLASGEPWPVAARGEEVALPEAREARIADWMLGACFALATEVLDAGLISLADLDPALSLALAMRSPFALMNRRGLGASLALVEAFAAENPGVKVAACLKTLAARGGRWEVPLVLREDRDGVAVLTIRRFKVLNALSAQVLGELDAHATAIAADDAVRGVVIRGYGTRAFVSGADIREISSVKSPEEAAAFARRGQGIFRRFETLGRPVVAAMNGLAFGGGNELAMACHARLAAAGQRVFAGQPEPKLGIIPGYGGTQRLPRLIGLAAAWPLLRTGEPISSEEAARLGLVREEVPREALVARAVALVNAAARGEVTLDPIPEGPIDVPETLPEVDIGHLSRRIDAVIQRVTLEGARTTLEAGLALEAEGFGECLTTEDTRIGLANFIEKGPRAPAPFVHR